METEESEIMNSILSACDNNVSAERGLKKIDMLQVNENKSSFLSMLVRCAEQRQSTRWVALHMKIH